LSEPPKLQCLNKIFQIQKSTKGSLLPLFPAAQEAKCIAPPASYLVERGSSWVTYRLSKVSKHLYGVKRGDLRLSLITLQPDFQKLADVQQAQETH